MKLIKDAPVIITPEIEIANMLANDGLPIVTHWYEPKQEFYDTAKKSTRNRADTDFWPVNDLSNNATGIHNFLAVNGASVVDTFFTAMPVDIDFDEYTVFAVAKISDRFTAAATGLFGANDTAAVVNMPYLHYFYNKEWRVNGAHTNGDQQFVAPMLITEARQYHVYTLTRSQAKGAALRIDGVVVGGSTSATAKAPITAKSMRLLGYNLGSSAFNGSVGNIIMCRKDLTDDLASMQKIESYLKTKYGI